MSTPPLRQSPPIHRATEDLGSYVRPLYREEFENLIVREAPDFPAPGLHHRFELLSGVMIEMGDASSGHRAAVDQVYDRVCAADLPRALLGKDCYFPLSVDSAPLVDLQVRVEPDPTIESDNPVVLIQVADTSLEKDRQIKAALYAAACVREYWIVDLQGDAIEVHRRPWVDRYPGFRRYMDVRRYERGERISSTALFPVEACVDDFFDALPGLH